VEERRAHQVPKVVHQLRRHDLAAELVGAHQRLPRRFDRGRRKVVHEVAVHRRIVQHVALQEQRLGVQLGVRQQDAQRGRGEPDPLARPLADLLGRGDPLLLAVQTPVALELADERREVVQRLP
jgi:hypothetical protein